MSNHYTHILAADQQRLDAAREHRAPITQEQREAWAAYLKARAEFDLERAQREHGASCVALVMGALKS